MAAYLHTGYSITEAVQESSPMRATKCVWAHKRSNPIKLRHFATLTVQRGPLWQNHKDVPHSL